MDKYVLITGANGGLGSETARYFVDNGYKVLALDLNNSNLIGIYEITFFKVNLKDVCEISTIIAKIISLNLDIVAVINMAGIFKMKSIIEADPADIEDIFQINFFGAYHINRLLIPSLEKGTKIINITSELARYSPQPFMAHYSISKKMLDSYSDVLRRECNYLGIKVIKVQSGSMKTNMLSKADSEYDKFIKETKYFEKPLAKMKYMMDNELKKTNSPKIVANLLLKIVNKKNPKICYKVKNSFKLQFMNILPEKFQDYLYRKIIK